MRPPTPMRGAARRRRCRFAAALLLLCALAAGVPVPRTVSAHEDPGVIALITDYGTSDAYVGILKGVLLRGCGDARLVDITHQVPPYDIRLAARLLYLAAREFPPATVFVAVVDPGVGTRRPPIALQTRNGMRFVGPDNGLFTLVADSMGVDRVRVISNPAYMTTSHRISSTFHGRDIFAPAAAFLACGTSIELLGPPAADLTRLEFPPAVVAAGTVTGEVDRVDTYGNVLTNIMREHLEAIGAAPGDTLVVRVGEREWNFPWLRTYGDVAAGSRVAVISSADELELAMNQESFGKASAAAEGTRVVVTRRGG